MCKFSTDHIAITVDTGSYSDLALVLGVVLRFMRLDDAAAAKAFHHTGAGRDPGNAVGVGIAIGVALITGLACIAFANLCATGVRLGRECGTPRPGGGLIGHGPPGERRACGAESCPVRFDDLRFARSNRQARGSRSIPRARRVVGNGTTCSSVSAGQCFASCRNASANGQPALNGDARKANPI